MKHATLLIAALLMSSAALAGQSDYHSLLVKNDVVRTFWSPCDLTKLRTDVELAEIDTYSKSGFILIAKIKLPATDENGMGIPECQYTFVRKSHLK